MHPFTKFVRSSIFIGFFFGISQAGNYSADTTVNGMKIQLHVSPAEQFFTKDQVSAGKAKNGMVVIRGAKPLPPDAETKPNLHLVVHVSDSLTTRPISNAKVRMRFRSLDEKSMQTGTPVDVPIVEMQAIGKGEESTHYGNNVVMQNGPYLIDVEVNGSKITFRTGRLFGPTSTAVEPKSSMGY